jgi:hypothetical protein
LAGLCLLPRVAQAEGAAAAEALFKKGLADFDAKKYDTGCPALEESFRVDPRAGSLFTTAECYAAAGKVSTASAMYEQFERFVERMPTAQQKGQAERLKVAGTQRVALAGRIPSLTVTLAAGTPANAVVRRNGMPVGKPSLGVALPVDPGEHTFVVAVEGRPTKEQKIVVKEGEKRTIELTAASDPAAATAPAAGAPAEASASVTPALPPPSSRKTVGYVVGGIGAAALIGGGVAGLLSASKKKTVDDECVGSACSPAGKAAADSGKTLATVSTVGVGVGVVGLAAGIYLIVSAPKTTAATAARFVAPTASPLPGGGFVGASGRFLGNSQQKQAACSIRQAACSSSAPASARRVPHGPHFIEESERTGGLFGIGGAAVLPNESSVERGRVLVRAGAGGGGGADVAVGNVVPVGNGVVGRGGAAVGRTVGAGDADAEAEGGVGEIGAT